MKPFAQLTKGITVTALVVLAGNAPALAGTFVYVSNAEDGDIATYRMLGSGEPQPGARAKAANVVMPMAVSPDRRFLYIWAADIHLTPNGKFLYISERTSSTLGAFSLSIHNVLNNGA